MTKMEIKTAAKKQFIEQLLKSIDLPYQVGATTYGVIETVTDESGKEYDVPLTIQVTAKAIEGDKTPYDIVFEDAEYAREVKQKAEDAARKKAEKEAKKAEKDAKKKEE